MATERKHIPANDWTELGTGPLVVGMDRGTVHFDTGTKPTDPRAGYLHSAQGQMRLVNFAGGDAVWARATDTPTSVILVTGEVAAQSTQNGVEVYQRYADLPDPVTQKVGYVAAVIADPNDGLNGLHLVHGTYWRAA